MGVSQVPFGVHLVINSDIVVSNNQLVVALFAHYCVIDLAPVAWSVYWRRIDRYDGNNCIIRANYVKGEGVRAINLGKVWNLTPARLFYENGYTPK